MAEPRKAVGVDGASAESWMTSLELRDVFLSDGDVRCPVCRDGAVLAEGARRRRRGQGRRRRRWRSGGTEEASGVRGRLLLRAACSRLASGVTEASIQCQVDGDHDASPAHAHRPRTVHSDATGPPCAPRYVGRTAPPSPERRAVTNFRKTVMRLPARRRCRCPTARMLRSWARETSWVAGAGRRAAPLVSAISGSSSAEW